MNKYLLLLLYLSMYVSTYKHIFYAVSILVWHPGIKLYILAIIIFDIKNISNYYYNRYIHLDY